PRAVGAGRRRAHRGRGPLPEQDSGPALARGVAGARGSALPVSRVLLVGLGDVGIRAARQLVETDGIDRVLLAGHRNRAVSELAESLGDRAEASDFRPGDPLPEVDAVAC